MKHQWLFMGCCATALLGSTSSASAVLQGLSVVAVPPLPEGGAPPAGGPHVIYHVFADFSSPSDRVNVWGGGGGLGNGIIQNTLADGTPGTGFTQVGGAGGQISPYESPNRHWDTFMTIGVRFAQQAPSGMDATSIIPGTPVFIAGAQWTAPAIGGGVFVTPNDVQGRADYIDQGPDTATRVLLMQLVVKEGEHARGTIGVAWSVHGVQESQVVQSGLTFNTIPGPGGMAMVLLAGFWPLCRRRRLPSRE